MPIRTQTDALRGSLDLLVLKTLSLAPMHGWGIGQRVQQISEGVLEMNQGSLYPALHRLEDRGLVEAEWGVSDEGRRAKFYTLTREGRAQFVEERESWGVFSEAMARVLQAG